MSNPIDVLASYEPTEESRIRSKSADMKWKMVSNTGDGAEFMLHYNNKERALVVKARSDDKQPIVGYAIVNPDEELHLFITAYGPRAGYNALFYYMRLIECYIYDNSIILARDA